MTSWSTFTAQRRAMNAQFFPHPEGHAHRPTVLVCSHIWWTEQVALAVLNAGCNLLLHFPFYALYTEDTAFQQFDTLWSQILRTLRESRVDLILGGNTSAMLVHPKTGELIHQAAGVPLVNWWWDEVRMRPPLAHAGISPGEFITLLGQPGITNALWDIDVKEELEAPPPIGFGLRNIIHLPLATLPEYWPHGYIPLEERPLAACFLGNCHFDATPLETRGDPLSAWALDTVSRKIAAPDRPMLACIQDSLHSLHLPFPIPADAPIPDPWQEFMRPWDCLNAGYMHRTRNRMVQAAERHLKGKLALVGKGWDKLRLRANMEHAGEKSGVIYGQSQISLNLFGGCVHGGLPLRPYDIGASGGLILTHDQRELPALFEPGAECLAFRSESEMLALIDKVRAAPAEFNRIAQAGRKRVLAHHTWQHRIESLFARIGFHG